jgi:uncharacterized protein DUF4337
VEPQEAADRIVEALEEERQELAHERAERRVSERHRTQSALVIAILAMLLALATLGGDHAKKELLNANILAADTWAFYQAKNIRQTSYALAADELETMAELGSPFLSESARQRIQTRIDNYRQTVSRYDDEPDPRDPGNPLKGEGKKQLQARAQHYEHERDHASAQDPNFIYSTAIYQIAIVLGSVAILATSRIILFGAITLGAVATILLVNGFMLLFPVP